MPIRAENRSRYPKDWALRSRFVRFYRAKNRCEWCGAKNGEAHPVTGSLVVLTTAHVFDDRPEACSLLNLAALCQKCHNGHDAKARQQRRRERRWRESGQLALTLASLVFLTIYPLGCASVTVLHREEVHPPADWTPEPGLRDCTPAGERLTLSTGQQVFVLACPDGRFVAADVRTGRRVQ